MSKGQVGANEAIMDDEGLASPANGKFFYCGNTTFKRFMQKAFDAAYGSANVPFLTRRSLR
jgi:hypothetical protein